MTKSQAPSPPATDTWCEEDATLCCFWHLRCRGCRCGVPEPVLTDAGAVRAVTRDPEGEGHSRAASLFFLVQNDAPGFCPPVAPPSPAEKGEFLVSSVCLLRGSARHSLLFLTCVWW